MEWIRNNTFFQKNNRTSINSEDWDPQACFDSFKGHWDQAQKIFLRVQQLPSHDDVLGVVNHLEQMVTLLLYDLKKLDRIRMTVNSSKCVEHLLNNNILDKIFEWGTRSGKYTNAVKCEQIKLYDTLIGQSRNLLFEQDAFLKPLLKLLLSCHGEAYSKEISRLLIDLLNQISALLVQHPELVKLFIVCDKNVNRFIVFSLLIPFMHKEDGIGMRARDALLLCMSLSKKNEEVALYILEHSNFSVLVASGLGGLYSVLPNIISDISVPDWHRFTPDDVSEIKGLLHFVTSLEFSNAIAQVAHPSIRRELQEFLYRGFLIPVLGAALLQSNVQEQVAATSYLELIIRTVTEPGLLHSVLRFLIKVEYDGERLLNILIQRIQSNNSQLCLVSLAVFESMVDLDCEDLLLELVFKYLQPCFHVIISQRKLLLPLNLLCPSFDRLLSLAPNCLELLNGTLNSDDNSISWKNFKQKRSLYGTYYAYLYDARHKIEQCQRSCSNWNNTYSGDKDIEEKSDSFTSLERSSGYESFNTFDDDCNEDSESWLISNQKQRKPNTSLNLNNHILEDAPTAGPFLTIIFNKLKNFLSNSIYVNLHLTGLITRLAVYPQTLLRAYLLDHNLVLQPNVPSIYEIIGIIKQQIDEYMNRQPNKWNLLKYAHDVLLQREIMLLNIRSYHLDKSPSMQQHQYEKNEIFQRNDSKRRSLNLPSLTSMFGRRSSNIENTLPMAPSPDELQLNLIYPQFNEGQHVAVCAVLLGEWVKELAALAQEHTIAQIATLIE
ncbi:FHIP family protein AGAP011705 [Anthonomus grandis grandis]|uniref:FHIP family protein AGAP011705 n=1 Tax=Anthonomus grandis grandis TaxID=2921223 RepID=UPI0021654347|nr:FHIP family protein AGAP011705 [Anthonomus grandis grandis]